MRFVSGFFRKEHNVPRVKALSAAQERQNELSARIVDLMNRQKLDNEAMAEYLGMCKRVFIQRKLHNPEDFRMDDIWKMEKLFGCKISEPLTRKEGTA